MSLVIFLSTVTDEFRDYRDQLRSDLTRHNVEVKVQEDFKDYGVATLEALDLYICSCDAVIHLVGDMTGSEANSASVRSLVAKYPDFTSKLPPLRHPMEQGLGLSYTQWEAWLALYHGKPLLIAKAADIASRGPKYVPTPASRAAQAAHLDRLREMERHPGCTFTSPDNLSKQIAYSTILDALAEARSAGRKNWWSHALVDPHSWLILSALCLPLIAAAQSFAPPWPPFLALFTIVTQILVALLVMHSARQNNRMLAYVSVAFLIVSASLYVPAVSLFTFEHPVTHERFEKGFVCNHDALLVYGEKCPDLGLEELRGVGYQADRLWTVRSITIVRSALISLWIIVFISIATLIGSFAASVKRRL